MREMCARAACVLTFAGPYDADGETGGVALARTCAELGTDYCDISGEPRFVRRVIEACDAEAARLVDRQSEDDVLIKAARIALEQEREAAVVGSVQTKVLRVEVETADRMKAEVLAMRDALS